MTAIQPIDKEFLEGVLNEPIKDFRVEAGCKAGDNVAGSLKSIIVTTASGKKKHFVFKRFPEQMSEENSFVVFAKAFWREHSLYKTVFPKLEEFAKSHGLDYLVPAPKYFKGYNDDKHDYILLEDVRPSGFIMPDKTISLTVEEMKFIMKEFAKFHAVTYAFLREQGERVFTEIDGFQFIGKDEMMVQIMETNFQLMVKQFYNVATTVLEDKFPEGAEKMKKYAERTGRLENTVEYLTDKKCFPTICHFDLWSNNMLIKHDKQGNPVDVKFIDFQFTQRGNVFTDLSYLIYTSTTPDFRRAHLTTVLDVYYNAFEETLEKIKVSLPWGFTKGFFFDVFQSSILTGFVRMTFAIPLQLGMITVTKKDEEDDHKEPSMGYTNEGIAKMFLDSPKAMERLEALVREMMELKLLV